MKKLIAFLLVFMGSAASAQMPAPPDRKAEPTHRDIAYAPPAPATSKGHLLDLYIPRGGSGPRPLVIWTSGSAFFSDQGKEGARYMAPELLTAGFAVAGVSVRSSSQTKFPGNLHDIKAAIRFLRVNAAKYGLDPDRIAIMGDSSGGWTSAMAAVTGDVPELEGTIGTLGVSSAVQAAVAFYPPTDFLIMDKWAPRRCIKGNARPGPGMCHDDLNSPESQLIGCAIQTCPDKVRLADPVSYVTPNDPPMMILHGRSDALVPHNQGERLFKALVQACTHAAVFYSLPLAGHGPAWGFLENENLKNGATYETAGGSGENCAADMPKLGRPYWAGVVSFLEHQLNEMKALARERQK